MNKAEKQAFVKTNAEYLFEDVTGTQIDSAKVAQLDSWIDEIKNNTDFSSDSSESEEEDEITLNGSDFFTTDKGIKVPIVSGVLVAIKPQMVSTEKGMIKNLHFQFETPIGKVSSNENRLATLYAKKKINIGDKFVFNMQQLKKKVYPNQVVWVAKSKEEKANDWSIFLDACNPILQEARIENELMNVDLILQSKKEEAQIAHLKKVNFKEEAIDIALGKTPEGALAELARAGLL